METENNTLLLKGGKVVDCEAGTISVMDVLVHDGKISKIAPNITPDNLVQVINCDGKIITSGYIDAHVHIESSMVLPQAFGARVLPFGTTCVIADPHELVNVSGIEGINLFLKEAEQAPIDIFTVVPSSVPATPYDTNGAGKVLAEDMKPLVNRPDIVGLGEVMCFGDVVNGNREILDKIELFKDKTIDGHTAGMPDSMLEAYVKAGVQNDHECIDEKALLARYNMGLNIYIREGSAARNAKELLTSLKKNNLDVAQFAFCTDDKHLATISAEGHISYIVAMALQMGFSWVDVARMASYNTCRYYRLDKRGNMKEGYIADIVVTNDDGSEIPYVIKNGKLVAKDNSLLIKVEKSKFEHKNTVKFDELKPSDFVLTETMKHIALELVDGQLITNKVELAEGEWKTLPMLATICRHARGDKNRPKAVCLIKGYGIKGGAVATSVSHDSHNVVCAGDNAEDMAMACNRLKTLGGGYVVVSKGEIKGEFALPAFGLMSLENAETASRQIQNVEEKAYELGVNPKIDAFITLSFVSLPVIPNIRLLDTGLFDVVNSRFIR